MWFFHAGESDADGSVMMTPGVDPSGGVFYGPRLPLPAGTYEAELVFETDAEPGRRVASFGAGDREIVAVRQGERCVLGFEQEDNTPVTLTLLYRGMEPLRVVRVVIRASTSVAGSE